MSGGVITINGNIACIKYDLVCGRGVDALCTDYKKAPTRDNIYLIEIKGRKLFDALGNIKKTLGEGSQYKLWPCIKA